jgi:23S rRNA (cytosine1962-C5)-methyltransferase
MKLLTPERFPDYELLDCGDFEKLERFGSVITIRPEPQAVWPRVWNTAEWERQAHVRFVQKSSSSGDWQKRKPVSDRWHISYPLPDATIQMRLAMTAFKHVGIFPEQAVNWDYIYRSIRETGIEQPRFLNLFAYTGGASLAARAAGADVTHLDSIKQVVNWANENMQLSGLDNIRWMVEDALKFAQREERRGNTYHGIIMDPPAFGHGPKGEKWKLEDSIATLTSSVLNLLDPERHFLIVNAYSLGLSALVLENLLNAKAGERLEIGELYLPAASGVKLPLGVFGRFRNF